jgi:hypothetical protein
MERASIVVESEAIYVVSGLTRTVRERSIPPVDHLRYSITFRELINDSDLLPAP